MAAEYALLEAHTLAVLQILVYAGAIVVLIVFVLMLMTVVGFLFALPLGTAAAAVVTLDRLEE